ncbi:MAG: exodeoxyribonuclease VII small subunit, partial [Myxococcales bacterium]|nr:exodeoxyribonuclease VII small subunit [Myxococcales bacterium]
MAEDTLIALDPASAPPFEEVLETLQTLVQRLEGGELALEESLRVFEEGVRLARLGTRQLDEAEQRVEAHAF